MFCGFCGREIPDQTKFCNSCGKPTDASPSALSQAPTTSGGAQAQQWGGPPPGQQAPWGGPAQGPNGAWAPSSQGSGAWGGQSQGQQFGGPQGAWGGTSQGQQGGWNAGPSQGQQGGWNPGPSQGQQGWSAGAPPGWSAGPFQGGASNAGVTQAGAWPSQGGGAQWGTIPSGGGQGYGPPPAYASTPPPPGGRQKRTEGDLMAMGAWCRIYSTVVIIVGVVIVVMMVMSPPRGREAEMITVMVGLTLVFGVVGYLLGVGLERFNDAARIVALILNALALAFWLYSGYAATLKGHGPEHLMGVGLGTGLMSAIYAYAIVVLARAGTVCTAAYKEALKNEPDKASMYSSVFFWVNILYFLFLLAVVAFALLISRTGLPLKG